MELLGIPLPLTGEKSNGDQGLQLGKYTEQSADFH